MKNGNIHNNIVFLDLFDLFGSVYVELVLEVDRELVGTLVLELRLGWEWFG